MKKSTLILIVAVVILLFILPKTCKNSNENDISTANTEVSVDKLKQLMSTEPSAKDYVLTEVGVLYVSVVDDGTRRDGLASYFCQLMKDENIKASRVKIVRFGSQNDPKRDNSYGVLLGESWCN